MPYLCRLSNANSIYCTVKPITKHIAPRCFSYIFLQHCFSSLLTNCWLFPPQFSYWLSASHVIDLQECYQKVSSSAFWSSFLHSRQNCQHTHLIAYVSHFYLTSMTSICLKVAPPLVREKRTCLKVATTLVRKPHRKCWTCPQIWTLSRVTTASRMNIWTLSCAGMLYSMCTARSVVTLTPLWWTKTKCQMTHLNFKMMNCKCHHHELCKIFAPCANVCTAEVQFPACQRWCHPCDVPACPRGRGETWSAHRCLLSQVHLQHPHTRTAEAILAMRLGVVPCCLRRSNALDAPVHPWLPLLWKVRRHLPLTDTHANPARLFHPLRPHPNAHREPACQVIPGQNWTQVGIPSDWTWATWTSALTARFNSDNVSLKTMMSPVVMKMTH